MYLKVLILFYDECGFSMYQLGTFTCSIGQTTCIAFITELATSYDDKLYPLFWQHWRQTSIRKKKLTQPLQPHDINGCEISRFLRILDISAQKASSPPFTHIRLNACTDKTNVWYVANEFGFPSVDLVSTKLDKDSDVFRQCYGNVSNIGVWQRSTYY